MIDKNNFANAYKEVYTILQHIEKKDVALIPKEFLDKIEKNMNKDYIYNYNEDIGFENNQMLRETKFIFSYIFLNYWANERQKQKIENMFKQDIIKAEEEKKQKYNSENFLKEKKKYEKQQSIQLIEYKKTNKLKKVIEKLKLFFLKK